MNTITKAAVLPVIASARVAEVLLEAANGFAKSYQAKQAIEATQEQIDAFVASIKSKVEASVQKAGPDNSVAIRQARIDAVTAAAKATGVKFLHARRKEFDEHPITIERIARNVTKETYGVYERNATLGGETLAYKYHLTDDNRLQIVYATAFCRDDENFDPLIGMEESLTKFNAGKVLYADLTHERLGEVKLAQLTRKSKHAYEPIAG